MIREVRKMGPLRSIVSWLRSKKYIILVPTDMTGVKCEEMDSFLRSKGITNVVILPIGDVKILEMD